MPKRKSIYNYRYRVKKNSSEEDDEGSEGGLPSLLPSLAPIAGGFLKNIFNKDDDEDDPHGKYNHIYFYDEVDRDSALDLCKKLRKVAHRLQEVQLRYDLEQPPKIYLHINSLGGCVFSAFTVVDTILQSPVPVVTIVEGGTASSGCIISIAGHERWMSEYAYFLIHQISSSAGGTYEELQDSMENWEEIMRRLKQHLHRFSNGKCNERALKDILNHDIWWSAKDCLDMNLIDNITTGTAQKIGNSVYVNKRRKTPTRQTKQST